jgi:hypothetical protein
MFYRWRRMDEENRPRVWRLYGWYSALMFCGSCVGTVTWAAWMQNVVNSAIRNFDTNLSLSQQLDHIALAFRWRSVFQVTYAIEFLCLSAAKLLVLDRMSDFAAGGAPRRWAVGGRIVMAAVVAGSVAGLAGNVAAAVYYERTAEFAFAASAAVADRDIASFSKNRQQVIDLQRLAVSTAAMQAFCEVAVLLLIVLSFAVVGVACARRVASAMPGLGAAGGVMAAGRQLWRQIVGTTGVVFVTFLLRSVYSTMSAVAFKLQDSDNSCPGNTQGFCNASCFNVFSNIVSWLTLTPEFQLMVVLLSKPLPLLVALWGMTSKRLLQQMQPGQRELATVTVKDSLLKKLTVWRRTGTPAMRCADIDTAAAAIQE